MEIWAHRFSSISMTPTCRPSRSTATKKAIYTSTRAAANSWQMRWDAVSSQGLSVSLNERSGEAVLSYQDRARTNVFSNELV
jgi:hypothetical protein